MGKNLKKKSKKSQNFNFIIEKKLKNEKLYIKKKSKKSQNFNLIPEKTLLNKKNVFLHKNKWYGGFGDKKLFF